MLNISSRLIQDAIITHITRNRIISCHQHGFQRMCSCITQLIECLNDWTDSFDNKLGTDALLLLSARIWHDKTANLRRINCFNLTLKRNHALKFFAPLDIPESK
jgi:hypothetical protein